MRLLFITIEMQRFELSHRSHHHHLKSKSSPLARATRCPAAAEPQIISAQLPAAGQFDF